MLGFSHTYSTPGVLARVRSEQNVEVGQGGGASDGASRMEVGDS